MFTGGVQSYVVPENVTAVVVHVWGAGGGGGKNRCDEMVLFLNVGGDDDGDAYVYSVYFLSLPPDLLCCASRIFITWLVICLPLIVDSHV